MDRRFARQSFLGPESEKILAGAAIGIVGFSGGGSPLGQQTAHLGVGHFVIVDPDHADETNIHRLIGASWQDVIDATPKVRIAERLIKSINPWAHVVPIEAEWQSVIEVLRSVDVLVGCVDTYRERDQLERFARRFLIPYLDLGMDVHRFPDGHVIGGQVVLSMPGHPCLWCTGILTEERLAEEARRYGDAGGRPQVVWSNGVLASIATALIVQLLTTWHGDPLASAYLEFDGNRLSVHTSNRFKLVRDTACPHYPDEAVGDPFFARG